MARVDVGGGVQIDLPSTYGLKMAVWHTPDESGEGLPEPAIAISRDRVDRTVTVQQFVDKQRKSLAAMDPSYQALRLEPITLPAGAGLVLESRMTGPRGVPLSSLMAFVVREGLALVLSVTDVAGERFEKRRAEIQALFQSVRW